MAGTQETKEENKSYASLDGPWRQQKISLFGVASSILTQLRKGADLTRLALPSVFCEPYSILEMSAGRLMPFLPALYKVLDQNTSIDRMISICRWYLHCFKDVTFFKKPYNSVLGETHKCKLSYEDTEAVFIAEQVSHHPPVSAFRVANSKLGIVIDTNIRLRPKFQGNSVFVSSDSFSIVYLEKFGEVYNLTKSVPDILIKNIILGTRVPEWTGSVSFTCEQNDLSVELNFMCKGRVEGQIFQGDQVLYSFGGNWIFDPIYCVGKDSSKILLFDPRSHREFKVDYPQEDIDPSDSLVIWKDVTRGIIRNDLKSADIAKERIEREQRERLSKQPEEFQVTKYFTLDPASKVWKWKENPSSPILDVSDKKDNSVLTV
eukprot:TRINITY_DN8721_c0_g1_i2.p1 TRINITY_DN8721_c0_g1~~TRINITY_DN8721_c0_g1_i2.p1  ORF type:complete len:376 (-),score=42.19 TRINITY_DN8721_c0_g1_i2:20-1147(-)